MRLSRSARRRGLAAIAVATAAATAIAMVATSNAQAVQQPSGGMSKSDRALLAQAVANGDATVTMLVAAKAGAEQQVASGLTGLGGKIGYREDELGYIRAEIPTAKAGDVAGLSGVEATEVDSTIPIGDPRPDGAVPPTPQTPPGPATPNNNPYMPIGDTGASQFMAAHPTWDGRGVTVGIVDTGVDLVNPALQTTSTGERKIIDWVTATHPTTDNDPTWVNMATAVTGPTFAVGGQTYTAPSTDSFRFGTINERDSRLGGEIGFDLNRDGNPSGSSGIFGVLWDGANTVWVDTDQDLSFADQSAMKDYKQTFDQGRFGTDNPATAIVEQLPFVVQVAKEFNRVNIGIVAAQHGSHVAGIVAANQMFGGAMSGAAPGAKIVSIRACLFIAGCTSHALLEGMIYAAKDAHVDVINMSIGGLPSLNDGNNARAVLYNRLIDKWDVQMFISAGNNGAGMNTVGDPSVATKVVSVGTYISKATWQSNYGSDSTLTDNQHGFSSRGPREDGGFKPTVIAPGAAISTTPLWQGGGPVGGTYVLPPGFSMLNGTSMASPQAAGAGALLVSAAKQAGVGYKPEQLRQAVTSSARFIANYQAYEQGNGLINVGAAYAMLAQNIKPVDISSSVPVNTALAGFLATPGFGVGIHDREGVTAGTPYTRTYTFTRSSGGNGPVTYNLSWVGNDGTFSSASTLSLPKGAPTDLVVNINPATIGEHSAILNVDDPGTVGIDYQTMNVVVAPDVFTAAGAYTVVKTGTVGRNQVLHFFYRVPAGTPAFKVDFSGPDGVGTGQARFVRFHPFGVNIDDNSSLNCYIPPVSGCSTGSPNSRTASNPQAGVWEIVVEARRTSDAVSTPFTLTASILGASVSPNPDIIASATVGVPVARSYTLTNLFGPFTGRAVGTNLGSARIAKPTIANLEMQETFVTVTPGTTSLRATIGGPSDPAADLDLFVFRCPTPTTCVLVAQNADGDSEESVTINNPTPGEWKILVDGFAVPAGTTTYNYVDVFTNAAFGSVSVTDANALRPAGSSWTVPGSVTANAVPAAGRVLLGNVQVRTDTNVLIGSGDVIIQSVTP